MLRTPLLALFALAFFLPAGCQTSERESSGMTTVSLTSLAQDDRPPEIGPTNIVRTVPIRWNIELNRFVIDQPQPLRLTYLDGFALQIVDLERAPEDVRGAEITRVHFYTAPRHGQAHKTPNRHFGSWHRSSTANPRVDLGAYSVKLDDDPTRVVITDIEVLSPPIEHRYLYSVEIDVGNVRHHVDPELINESGRP